MGVQLSPGCSGNRNDAKPPLPSGQSQPVPITTTNAADDTRFPMYHGTTPARDQGYANLPTGGENDIKGGYV